MSWRVEYAKTFWDQVKRVLRGIPRDERVKIIRKIDEIATVLITTAHPANRYDLRKVRGKRYTEIRVRIGKYRLIYRVFKKERCILLVDIVRRDESTYKRVL